MTLQTHGSNSNECSKKKEKKNAMALGNECQDKESSICEVDTQSKGHKKCDSWPLNHWFMSPWGKIFGGKEKKKSKNEFWKLHIQIYHLPVWMP